MFTSNVKSYEIDLSQDEEDRWLEVICADWRMARKVAKEAAAACSRTYPSLLGPIFKFVYDLTGGRFGGEIYSWANALGISAGETTILNCTYELSHLRSYRGPFGCTAGVKWIKSLGMVHVRNLDWPLPSMGDATRVFWFRKGRHKFVTVGVPGFVGALSGMVPHSYSATINWAPPAGRPKFDFGPAFLLREVLEDCATYDEAVYCLQNTILSSPVFFLVCGTKKGQACVIERTHSGAAVRKMTGAALVQANHHVARKFSSHNEHQDLDSEYSKARAVTLAAGLSRIDQTSTLDKVANTLDEETVCNSNTYQQMVFCPRSGKLKVWRWKTK